MTHSRIEAPGVQGWLHTPSSSPRGALALTHGAGSNCDAALLVAVAEAFVSSGHAVLRFDLPYRQARPRGAPHPSGAARDREGIRQALDSLRGAAPKVPLWLGGQSYGGRQASMAASEDAKLADGLLLLSYPLHPPGQPNKLRTEHFPSLRTPAFFVHGTRDAFGSIEEIEIARPKIHARTELYIVEGGGHGVPPKTASEIATRFLKWIAE